MPRPSAACLVNRQGFMPKVTWTDLDGVQRERTLHTRLTVGRSPGQDLQLLDRLVSKEHAYFETDGAGMWIVDAGSRNGTLLNGRLITGRMALKDADVVTFGGFAVTVHDATTEVDRSRSQVRILDDAPETAIRKRIRPDTVRSFPRAEEVRDVDTLRHDYDKMRVALELQDALSKEFEIDRILNRIVDVALDLFGADRGTILVESSPGQWLPSVVKTRNMQLMAGQAMRISRTILNEVIQKREGLLSSDAQIDQRFGGAQSIILSGIRSTMTAPMLYRETLVGILHLDSRLAANAFTERDLVLLSGFAVQAANAIEHSRLLDRMKSEALAREQLGRLLPPELVDDVMSGRVQVQRGGGLQEATVLFCDIRGFTAMSETLPPQDVVAMLNEYFEDMVEIVFRYGGSLDKFIGDEIMAVWGAPIRTDNHCAQAVRAAVRMQRALVAFNERREAAGQRPIQCGIGVNTGELVAGYMGSSRAMDYTVIGDVVNTASRLCSAAAAGEVIVSRGVVEQMGDLLRYEQLPARSLKGKRDAVELYRVLDVVEPG
jgi:adenylate cyclase